MKGLFTKSGHYTCNRLVTSEMGMFRQLPQPARNVQDHPNENEEPALNKVHAVWCPTCGSGPGEKCELSTGQPRTEPHRDRLLACMGQKDLTTPTQRV
jgi:hypothetical protein